LSVAGQRRLVNLELLPVRVSRFKAWYQDEIVEPDYDSLICVGAQVKMDMLPLTLY
jgi:hypothetical protein